MPASFLEHLVEDEFHHQERRPGVKLVAVLHDGGVAPTDLIFFFKNRDLETAVSEDHRGRQATRAGADDVDVLLGSVGH